MNFDKVNEFIKNSIIQKNIYRPMYHFSPSIGWCNDPHGIIYFNDEYHIYFQYYPFLNEEFKMHWGHVTTKDFVHFSNLSSVIMPSESYDNKACWSGSVFVKDKLIYLYYTSVTTNENNENIQTISLATSADGINFEKYKNNPIITPNMCENITNNIDFRDPCIFQKDGKYYIVIGSKNKNNEGLLLLFESENLYDFKFNKILLNDKALGSMYECPNFVFDNEDVFLIASCIDLKQRNNDFLNNASSVCCKINYDFVEQGIKIESLKEIDHGLEFYAPNIYNEHKIMVAWNQMWGRNFYLQKTDSQYINNFVLFRNYFKENNSLIFKPVKRYDSFFKVRMNKELSLKNEKVTFNNTRVSKISINLKNPKDRAIEFHILKDKNEFVKLDLDFKNNLATIDRSNNEIQLKGVEQNSSSNGTRYLTLNKGENYSLEIYIDNSAIEIFLNNFKDSISLLSFLKGDGFEIIPKQDIDLSIQIADFDSAK